MKINFELPTDGKYHQFCPNCYSEKIQRVFQNEKTFYHCASCKQRFPRMIVLDPEIVWWIDQKTKEYWHESVGIFLFNEKKEALFFKRTIFPFAYTIPAGHLDEGEKPETAIKRELSEEAGIHLDSISLIVSESVIGDKCRRGADSHKWHLFGGKVYSDLKVTINDEGIEPTWMDLKEVLVKDPIYPVQFFIEKYGDKLLSKFF